jgi:glyoxylase-like metal-dependent hydrolase (beta-lactamase superfamily II)
MSTAALSNTGKARANPLPRVEAFFEHRTCSVQYVLSDPATGTCAIIDPVLDYDERSGSVATNSADALLAYVGENGFNVAWILDTHPHADHLSAADYLKQKTGAPTGIGEKIVGVQKLWKSLYNLPATFPTDGSQWDRLFANGDRFRVGSLDVDVIFSPGHTLASVTYLAGDAAFVHDSLLMPDFGTARCDFPGGDARELWATLERILSLPANTVSSLDTITCRGAANRLGRVPLRNRRPATSTSGRRGMSRNLSRYAKREMPCCRCRSSSFTRCRSTSQQANCPNPRRMEEPI